jgi:hypothetical protein
MNTEDEEKGFAKSGFWLLAFGPTPSLFGFALTENLWLWFRSPDHPVTGSPDLTQFSRLYIFALSISNK